MGLRFAKMRCFQQRRPATELPDIDELRFLSAFVRRIFGKTGRPGRDDGSN